MLKVFRTILYWNVWEIVIITIVNVLNLGKCPDLLGGQHEYCVCMSMCLCVYVMCVHMLFRMRSYTFPLNIHNGQTILLQVRVLARSNTLSHFRVAVTSSHTRYNWIYWCPVMRGRHNIRPPLIHQWNDPIKHLYCKSLFQNKQIQIPIVNNYIVRSYRDVIVCLYFFICT